MIIEIGIDKINDITSTLDNFRERYGENSIPENFFEQIKTSISNDRISLFGAYDVNQNLKGIGLFGIASGRILLIFADGNLQYENQLVNAICDRFLEEYSYIATGGSLIPWISTPLSQHLIETGFMQYDRAHMTLEKNDVELLDEPLLPSGISFQIYSSSKHDETSELIFRGTDGSVDQEVFPDFFGSLENCSKVLQDIENNRYGEYKEGLSWVLIFDNTIIGCCFMTLMEGNVGYIPEIVIDPEYRGKGLGKAILVHSMKRQIESDSDICKIDLYVTLRNDARYLYKSLGFKTVGEFSMYTLKR